jgi:hypothetical protein
VATSITKHGEMEWKPKSIKYRHKEEHIMIFTDTIHSEGFSMTIIFAYNHRDILIK